MTKLALNIPTHLRRGHLKLREIESVESGVELISWMCGALGLEDLGSSSVLDMGCGCKFTQAILDRNLPVGRYVGADVYAEMIEFLQLNVDDPRFSFHHLNTHNEMYNPLGKPLSANTQLSVGEEKFDIICLFSVFTHLAPHDYVTMLKMLRQYIKPDGRLFFSLFIHEITEGGLGEMDAVMRAFEALDESAREKYRKNFEGDNLNNDPPDFLDFIPEKPLKVAMYSRKHALELIENTGWEVESLNDPGELIQHSMICKPV
jgi:SAM-dependent methyltransferase